MEGNQKKVDEESGFSASAMWNKRLAESQTQSGTPRKLDAIFRCLHAV
jgi:hypothetical protein